MCLERVSKKSSTRREGSVACQMRDCNSLGRARRGNGGCDWVCDSRDIAIGCSIVFFLKELQAKICCGNGTIVLLDGAMEGSAVFLSPFEWV